MKHNVIYIGNSGKGCDYIHCHDQFNVVAAVCHHTMVNEDLLTCCFVRDIPLLEIDSYLDLRRVLEEWQGEVDMAIMFSFAIILKEDILNLLPVYNIHMSALPQYKGRHSTFYPTMAGEKKIGATLHEVVTGIDEGEIISQVLVPYYYWMGEAALWDKLLEQIPALLDGLNRYLENPNRVLLISNSKGHYFPPVDSSVLRVTAGTPVKDIINLTRTQQKYSGIRFQYQQNEYPVKKASVCLLKTLAEFEEVENVLLKDNRPVGVRINEKYYLKFE